MPRRRRAGQGSWGLWSGPAPGVLRPGGGPGRWGGARVGGAAVLLHRRWLPAPATHPRVSPERRARSRPRPACSSESPTGVGLIPEVFLLSAAFRLVQPERQGGIWAPFGRNSPRWPCTQRCLLVFPGSVASPGALFAAEASVGLVTGPAERRRRPRFPGGVCWEGFTDPCKWGGLQTRT